MKQTTLYQWHVENGAKMACFGGYQMPLWYPVGAKQEHLSVITQAGLFDTSHMATLMIKGSGARNLLQKTHTKDLERAIGAKQAPLTVGRCVYGAFLTLKGEVMDDAIINMMEENLYMVVVNAGMGGAIAQHLGEQPESEGVEIVDMSDTLGKMDVQGPAAAQILSKLLPKADEIFASMPYFTFKGHFAKGEPPVGMAVELADGTPVLLSRTGYTGEFGFELFVSSEVTARVWSLLLEAGKEYGLTVCGLAARDSLRAGAVLPLSHQDIGHWPFCNHPWKFALPYYQSGSAFTKSFIGDGALLSAGNATWTYAFAGYNPRKVSGSGEAQVENTQGNTIGTVLTCATDMAIGRDDGTIYSMASSDAPQGFTPRGLSCGFVKVTEELKPGTVVTLTEGKKRFEVEIVEDVRPARTARRSLKSMR